MKRFWGDSILLIGLCTLCFTCNVNAQAYYTNSMGVEMTRAQYDHMMETFSEKKVDVLTQSEFDFLKDTILVTSSSKFHKEIYEDGELVYNEEISEKEYEAAEDVNSCSPYYSRYVETSYKKLTGSSHLVSGNTYSMIGALTWKQPPKYRSYDVFAFRVQNMTYKGFSGSQVFYKGNDAYRIDYTTSSAGYKSFGNGIGVSMNLKDDNDITAYDMTIVSTITPKTEVTANYGHLYVSYQHAQANVSRAQSMNYTLDISGLGNVVNFDSSVEGYYDGMNGVCLDIPLR